MYHLTRATSDDVDVVAQILIERAAWLAARGFDQWSEKDPTRSTAATVANGETWLLTDPHGVPAGTMTMSTLPDPDFWSSAIRPALYLSKIATRDTHAGLGLGELLVQAACRYAARRQVPEIRWDVWRTNTRLQAYYQGIGGELIGVVEVPGRQSGALFKMQTSNRRGYDLQVWDRIVIDAPQHVVCELDSTIEHRTYTLGEQLTDPEGYQGTPSHSHTALHLTRYDGQPFTMHNATADPANLLHTGDTWRLNGLPVTGSELDPLRPGHVYQIRHSGPLSECRLEIVGDVLNGDRQPQHV